MSLTKSQEKHLNTEFNKKYESFVGLVECKRA